MSVENLYVSVQDGVARKVRLSKIGAHKLFEFMLSGMTVAAAEYADNFEGAYYGGVLSVNGVSDADYMAVVELVLSAFDQVPELAEYKAALQAALEADPRFKKATA